MNETETTTTVDDPFVGRRRVRHCASWRYYDAGDDIIALCGKRLSGNRVLDIAKRNSLPECQRCREIATALQVQGLTRRQGWYRDYVKDRIGEAP